MASSSISARLGLLLCLTVACAIGGAAAFVFSKAYVAGALLIAAAILQVFLMVYLLGVHQREIARFIDAVRFSDLSQTFSDRQVAKRLAQSLNAALARLRDTVSSRDAETALLRALFEHAPVAVLAIGPRGSIDIMNEAARRLFGRGEAAWVNDFSKVSTELAANLAPDAPAGRFIVRADLDDRVVRLVVSSASLRVRGQETRIISIQNIESELGSAEFDAWRDLIRVLTHEIMNTLTPVASLSQLIHSQATDVAAALDAKEGGERAKSAATDLAESAVALSARTEALTRFIGAYRQLTRLPPPRRQEVRVSELLGRLLALQRNDESTSLAACVRPADLKVDADPDQLEQALLNLITNAREASIAASATAPVEIEASVDRSGAVAFSVSDAGPGVAEDARGRIFTPFFSTKPGGSGVGLSLVRQIALAHGGSVDHQPKEGGGSVFTLRLPARSPN